ncbi:NAD(P)H-binding protein [Streptomyces sp. SID13031]|uniref:NAD(P)-dependent oxidoreductase n=1 Tax=Streptomyces sp. SID13031 TaxID=2706046 RepID=UPI0013CC95A8|nr:NAD(P)H-binding protein [Streptomyces sp. SID13031]NEA30378.1 NAD(P)H-binding protein [Streptomyces sp. SID13031]
MRITIFGATGAVGTRAVKEALTRGHQVTAVGRTKERLQSLALSLATEAPAGSGGLWLERGDASDSGDVARLSRGQDVLISATRPVAGQEDELAIAAKGLVSGLAGSDTRLVIVGGAASLTVPGDAGTMVVDAPGFPAELRPIALACNEQLQVVRGSSGVDWAYVSPPAVLEPGTRTGEYRVGRDELLVGDDGESYISMEDFAVALLDEAERPKHHRTRFTVGY